MLPISSYTEEVCDGAGAMRAVLPERLVGGLSSVNVTVLVEIGMPVIAPLGPPLNESSVSVTVNVVLTQSEVVIGGGGGDKYSSAQNGTMASHTWPAPADSNWQYIWKIRWLHCGLFMNMVLFLSGMG